MVRKMNDYETLREQRDVLVQRYISLSDQLEEYEVSKIPDASMGRILALIMRITDGSLHRYPQEAEALQKANVALSQDIEQFGLVYQEIACARKTRREARNFRFWRKK